MSVFDSHIDSARARVEKASKLVAESTGINLEYVSLQEGQKPKDYVDNTGLPYGQYPIAGDMIQRVEWNSDTQQWDDFGAPIPTKQYVDDRGTVSADPNKKPFKLRGATTSEIQNDTETIEGRTVYYDTDEDRGVLGSIKQYLVGFRDVFIKINSIEDLEGDTPGFWETLFSARPTRKPIGFYPDTEVGGGEFVWMPNLSKSEHNGGSIINPDHNSFSQSGIGSEEWYSSTGDSTDDTGSGCWKRPERESVDVKEFGITADGTNEFNRLDAVFSSVGSNSIINIINQDILCESKLTISTNRITIKAVNSSLYNSADNSLGGMITLDEADYFHISGLEIDVENKSSRNGNGTQNNGININSSSYCLIEKCTFKDCQYGVNIFDGYGNIVENNDFEECFYAGDIGTGAARFNLYTKNRVTKFHSNGFKFKGSAIDNVVYKNTIEDPWRIALSPPNLHGIRLGELDIDGSAVIEGNIIDMFDTTNGANAGYGIWEDNSANTRDYAIIHNNTIHNCSDYGVEYRTKNVTVTDNTFDGCATNIYARGGDSLIEGNDFISSTSGFGSIRVILNSPTLVINDNLFKNDSSRSIRLSSTSSDILISGNKLNSPILLEDDCDDIFIDGNKIDSSIVNNTTGNNIRYGENDGINERLYGAFDTNGGYLHRNLVSTTIADTVTDILASIDVSSFIEARIAITIDYQAFSEPSSFAAGNETAIVKMAALTDNSNNVTLSTVDKSNIVTTSDSDTTSISFSLNNNSGVVEVQATASNSNGVDVGIVANIEIIALQSSDFNNEPNITYLP